MGAKRPKPGFWKHPTQPLDREYLPVQIKPPIVPIIKPIEDVFPEDFQDTVVKDKYVSKTIGVTARDAVKGLLYATRVLRPPQFTYKVSDQPMRTKLPVTRKSITHKFDLEGHECYITVGLYEDGQPGELFIKMAKMGSTVSGFADTMGILFSLALQHGVPLKVITDKLRYTLFEPNESGKATSVPDYICKWMDEQFGEKEL